MRKIVTIRIDPEVWRTARKLGLNISRTCENALKHEIQQITKIKQKGNYKLPSDGKAQPPRMVDGAGFEPATSAMPTPRSFQADLPAHS